MTCKRYERNLALTAVGPQGQQAWESARVAVVGAGGLGSPLLYYLAAAGVGHLAIFDCDVVEETNLNRQILHAVDRIGESKATSAARTLLSFNPGISVTAHAREINTKNCAELLSGYDLIVDATDNFSTKFLLATYAVEQKRNLVWGTVVGLHAKLGCYLPNLVAHGGATLLDLYPHVPEATTDVPAGVLGASCGVAGSLMATMALGALAKTWLPKRKEIILVDTMTATVRPLELK
ncbi:MAG: HesA/MoeB/ThiF family protein [Actinomycetaceae bacterium]|nr:HesA/MoeB/ThiF family protein [Actinomycetaceae bacterium]